eukprot:TRINITY_DN4780_c0_g1_i1.p1 TRINITY_DN4780_c0_g1~~TRINITY_DN4780_c0_g1_i1.p1  ORF type:complete len:1330 (+),score=376.07 TRINITY_DN4780_c0_g1_i1:77-4066(+)
MAADTSFCTQEVVALRFKFLSNRSCKQKGEPGGMHGKLLLGGLQLIPGTNYDGVLDHRPGADREVHYTVWRVTDSDECSKWRPDYGEGFEPCNGGRLLWTTPKCRDEEHEQEKVRPWHDPRGCGDRGSALFVVLDKPRRLGGYRIMSAPAVRADECCSKNDAEIDAHTGHKHDPFRWQVHVMFADDAGDGLPQGHECRPWAAWPRHASCCSPPELPAELAALFGPERTWRIAHSHVNRYTIRAKRARWSLPQLFDTDPDEELSVDQVRRRYTELGWTRPDTQKIPQRQWHREAHRPPDSPRPGRTRTDCGTWALDTATGEAVWEKVRGGFSQWDFADGTSRSADSDFMRRRPRLRGADYRDPDRLAGWVAWMLAEATNERMKMMPTAELLEAKALSWKHQDDTSPEEDDDWCCSCLLSWVPCSSRCLWMEADDVALWMKRPRCCNADLSRRCPPLAHCCRRLVIEEEEDVFTEAYEKWSRAYCYRWREDQEASVNFFDPCDDLYQEMTCRWIDMANKLEDHEIETARIILYKHCVAQVLCAFSVFVLAAYTLADPLSVQTEQYIVSQFITGAISVAAAVFGFLGTVGRNEKLLRTTFILNIWLLAVFTVYLAWVLFDASEVTDVCWPNMFNYMISQSKYDCYIAVAKYCSKIAVTFLGALVAYSSALFAFALLDSLNDKAEAENERLIFRYLETVAQQHVVPWSRYESLQQRIECLERFHFCQPPEPPPQPPLQPGKPDEVHDHHHHHHHHPLAPGQTAKIEIFIDTPPQGPLPPPRPPPPTQGLSAVVSPFDGHPLVLWDNFTIEWEFLDGAQDVDGEPMEVGVRVVAFDGSFEFRPLSAHHVPLEENECGIHSEAVPPSGGGGPVRHRTHVRLIAPGGGRGAVPEQWVHIVFFFVPSRRPVGDATLRGRILSQSGDRRPLGTFAMHVGDRSLRRRQGRHGAASCFVLNRLPQCDPPLTAADGSPRTRFMLWHLQPTLGGGGTDELIWEARRRLLRLERPSPPHSLALPHARSRPLGDSFTVELWWQMKRGCEKTGMDIFGLILRTPQPEGAGQGKAEILRLREGDGGEIARVDGFYKDAASRQWPPHGNRLDRFWVIDHVTGDKESVPGKDQCEALSIELRNLERLARGTPPAYDSAEPEQDMLEPRGDPTGTDIVLYFGAYSTVYSPPPGAAAKESVAQRLEEAAEAGAHAARRDVGELHAEQGWGGELRGLEGAAGDAWRAAESRWNAPPAAASHASTTFNALLHGSVVVRGHNGACIGAAAIETGELDVHANAMVAFAVRQYPCGQWYLQELVHSLVVEAGKTNAQQVFEEISRHEARWKKEAE